MYVDKVHMQRMFRVLTFTDEYIKSDEDEDTLENIRHSIMNPGAMYASRSNSIVSPRPGDIAGNIFNC